MREKNCVPLVNEYIKLFLLLSWGLQLSKAYGAFVAKAFLPVVTPVQLFDEFCMLLNIVTSSVKTQLEEIR